MTMVTAAQFVQEVLELLARGENQAEVARRVEGYHQRLAGAGAEVRARFAADLSRILRILRADQLPEVR